MLLLGSICSDHEDEDVDEDVRQFTNVFVVDRSNGGLDDFLLLDVDEVDDELDADEVDEFLLKRRKFENLVFLFPNRFGVCIPSFTISFRTVSTVWVVFSDLLVIDLDLLLVA